MNVSIPCAWIALKIVQILHTFSEIGFFFSRWHLAIAITSLLFVFRSQLFYVRARPVGHLTVVRLRVGKTSHWSKLNSVSEGRRRNKVL